MDCDQTAESAAESLREREQSTHRGEDTTQSVPVRTWGNAASKVTCPGKSEHGLTSLRRKSWKTQEVHVK
ncbi:unnamed protein product [Caretta caretta]